nr:serine/threonine-protein phosphatase 4 regulatory subunit 4-like [Chelonoidis abingdonii]
MTLKSVSLLDVLVVCCIYTIVYYFIFAGLDGSWFAKGCSYYVHPLIISSKMDFSQNNLFGYIEDLQELTIIERPVRRSLKTPEEIERLTVDEELNDIERAVYLLRSCFQQYVIIGTLSE